MERIFLDANVLIDGMVSRWSVSRAVLVLCANRVARLVLAEYVKIEVENALLTIAQSNRFKPREANRMLEDYERFLQLAKPEIVTATESRPLMQQAAIIHHIHDVPVLAAALKAQPDWLLSLNRKHFSRAIGQRTGLVIGDPLDYFRARLWGA